MLISELHQLRRTIAQYRFSLLTVACARRDAIVMNVWVQYQFEARTRELREGGGEGGYGISISP